MVSLCKISLMSSKSCIKNTSYNRLNIEYVIHSGASPSPASSLTAAENYIQKGVVNLEKTLEIQTGKKEDGASYM